MMISKMKWRVKASKIRKMKYISRDRSKGIKVGVNLGRNSVRYLTKSMMGTESFQSCRLHISQPKSKNLLNKSTHNRKTIVLQP